MSNLKHLYIKKYNCLNILKKQNFTALTKLASHKAYSTNNDYQLRPSFELALRAASIQLVLARWGLETATKMDIASGKDALQDERRSKAIEAIRNTVLNGGLQDSLTEEELTIIKKDHGAWEGKDFLYGKHWESLGIFSWLLGRRNEIPHYFSNFDRVQLFQSTGILPGDTKTVDSFVNSYMSIQAKFTIENDILKKQMDLAEIWYWRARLQVLMDLRDDILINEQKDLDKNNSDSNNSDQFEISNKRILEYLRAKNIPTSLRPIIKNIPDILHSATKRAIELGLLSQSTDRDFGVLAEIIESTNPSGHHKKNSEDGKKESILKYADLDSKDHDALMNIAESRMMAFAWATGKIDKWSTEEMHNVGLINPLNVLWAPENK
ncbi:hypothetical protein BB561_000552 [Smittium simulii]|uniref:Uncharacterized protein n=1 Tax=Smittium simulii TaxID=133385 RepID=A0A2T9YYR9_9FUNG|nr:hypothetical protein BB561_000552 [Smittium simulii]